MERFKNTSISEPESSLKKQVQGTKKGGNDGYGRIHRPQKGTLRHTRRTVYTETMNTVNELEEAYNKYKEDPAFQAELTELLNEYGRPSRLYYAGRMTEALGGAKIYLKREDLESYRSA